MNSESFYDYDSELVGVLQHEPSAFVWETKEGLRGLVFRQKSMNHYCGYLELGDHVTRYDTYDDLDVRVHGGLTYMGRLEFASIEYPDLKKFELSVGFDTAHAGDLVPGLVLLMKGNYLQDRDTYRDFEYVFNEVNDLSEQVAARLRS